MADNITLSTNIGSGSVIATEDEGGFHYQKVKLVASGTGTTAALSFAEDTAHTTGDHGIQALVVRNDTLAALAGTDGDYAPMQVNASGALYIQEGAAMDVSAATVTVDWAGTAPPIGAGLEATALRVTLATDSTGVITANPASGTIDTVTNLAQMGGVAISLNTGVRDAGTQRVTIATDDAVPVTNAGLTELAAAINSNRVDVNIAANALDSSTFIDDGEWTALTSYHTLIGGIYQSVPGTITDGDTGPLRMSANGEAQVIDTDGNALLTTIDADTGTIAGDTTSIDGKITACDTGAVVISSGTITAVTDITNTIDSTISGAALTALQLIDNPIVAHDAAISGATGVNVIGARAVASVEAQTETTAADASHINATLSGNLITQSQVAPEELVNYHVVNTAGTELTVTGLDAGGANIYNYITSIIVHNAHASTNGFIQLLDGTGGTPFVTVPAPATGGAVINFNPPKKQPTANTACFWDASAAITTLYVTIGGYQGQG